MKKFFKYINWTRKDTKTLLWRLLWSIIFSAIASVVTTLIVLQH